MTQGTPSRWAGDLQATLWAFEPEPEADRKEVGPACFPEQGSELHLF